MQQTDLCWDALFPTIGSGRSQPGLGPQVLWADDGVRLRRALNSLLERAYTPRQARGERLPSANYSIRFCSSICGFPLKFGQQKLSIYTYIYSYDTTLVLLAPEFFVVLPPPVTE